MTEATALAAMNVDPAIVAAIESGVVPPSITASYLMQNRDCAAKIAILFVVCFTAIIVFLRFVSRWTVRRLGIDDAFAGLSLVCSLRSPETTSTHTFPSSSRSPLSCSACSPSTLAPGGTCNISSTS